MERINTSTEIGVNNTWSEYQRNVSTTSAFTFETTQEDFLGCPAMEELGFTESDFYPVEELSRSLKTLFTCIYVILIVTSVAGNCVVIAIVIANQKMRTVTNAFLVSLAISDMLIALFNMPFQLMFYLTPHWTLGGFLCKFSKYMQGVSITATILTLTGIAVDRYYAIMYPFQARHIHTTKRAMIILCTFWALALVLVSPQFMISKVIFSLKSYPAPICFDLIAVCVEIFPDDRLDIAYTLFYQVALCLVPVTVMVVSYGMIAQRLWFRQIIGDTYDTRKEQERRLREKKRVVRMLIVVVGLFVLSWFPFFSFQVYESFADQIHYNSQLRITMAALQLLGYSNCCTNPVVYWFMNESFQQHFYSTFCSCRYIRTRRRSSLDFDRVVQSSTNQSSV